MSNSTELNQIDDSIQRIRGATHPTFDDASRAERTIRYLKARKEEIKTGGNVRPWR